MPGSQMKFVTLAQSPGRGAATGHKWGVWAEPHILRLEVSDISF